MRSTGQPTKPPDKTLTPQRGPINQGIGDNGDLDHSRPLIGRFPMINPIDDRPSADRSQDIPGTMAAMIARGSRTNLHADSRR